MGIKDKASYGEYYWAMQVEAAKFFDEEMESAFAPYFRGMLADIDGIRDLPRGMRKFIDVLSKPPSAGFGGFALGVGVEMIDEILHTALNPMMKMVGRSLNRRAKETWLTSEQANTLFRQGKITQGLWYETITSEGYETSLGRFQYMSQLPYPSIPDIVLYSRYHGNPDSPWSQVHKWVDMSARDWPLWEWMGKQRLTTMQAQTLFRRGLISEGSLTYKLAEIGWSREDRDFVKEIGWTIPNAMLLVQGDLQQDKSDDDLIRDISLADINPKYAQQYLDAILT
ncbi:unnamed protein product, partial [marine sediment metagenome]